MISVCIPTYNGERYIKEQIDSILSQLSDEDEIVISDDSSTDSTLEIIKDYNDNRIRIFHGNFRSPIYNLENALKNARGPHIFIADQDDIWMPNKVEVMHKYLETYDCVVSDARVIDDEKNVLHESFYELRHSKAGLIHNLARNSYLGCCMAITKQLCEAALPFPKDIPMHDIWIGSVAECFGRSIFIPDKLISYRRHGGNVSSTSEKSPYSLKEKIGFRVAIIKNLVIRKRNRIICA